MPVIRIALGLIVLLFVVTLLLRLRLRLIISDHQRTLFAGLGRTGAEFDFLAKRGGLRLFGFRVKSFDLHKRDDTEGTKIEDKGGEERATKEDEVPRRKVAWREWLNVAGDSRKAIVGFVRGIFRGLIVEELYGQVRAGFEEPDLTGEAFGYYFALMASVPEAHRHFRFEPDWMGPSFSGTLRLSVALPLYCLVWQVVLLLVRLPLRQIRELTIKRERGVSHA